MIKPAIALLVPLLLARVGCSEEIKSIVLSKKEAITIAEKFVAAQGYTGKSPDVSLQPHAVGARMEANLWFIGFQATNLPVIRGIVVNAQTRATKLVSQQIQKSWLTEFDKDQPSTAAAKPASADKPKEAKPKPAKAKSKKKTVGDKKSEKSAGQ